MMTTPRAHPVRPPEATPDPVQPPTPLMMLQQAVQAGASIDVLERLMALSERWQTQQARRAFDAAIAAARPDLPPILKSRQVDFMTAKGRTRYAYEDLASMVEAIAPALARHGLNFRWRTDATQRGQISVTCVLAHRDGHSEETTLSGPYDESGNKNPIQAIGSVVTYLQRYTLKAAVGVAASVDDDGRQGAAQGHPPVASPPPAGYDEWWQSLEAAAVKGRTALEGAFRAAPDGARVWLHQHQRPAWDALKEHAEHADHGEPHPQPSATGEEVFVDDIPF